MSRAMSKKIDNQTPEIIMRYATIVLLLIVFLVAGDRPKTAPQDFGAKLIYNVPVPQQSSNAALSKSATASTMDTVHAGGLGYTLRRVPFDEGLGIDAFTRSTAQRWLERDLFYQPQHTATWFEMNLDNGVNPVGDYIQFVSDPGWERIVFGRLGGAMKVYDDIHSPGAMAIGPDGVLFVAEEGRQRIQVLRIERDADEPRLELLGYMERLKTPAGLACSDNGAAQEKGDDLLFVTDASANSIFVFEAGPSGARIAAFEKDLLSPRAIAGHTHDDGTVSVFVVDKYDRRLSRLNYKDGNFTLQQQILARPGSVFASISTDYFGQLYVADGAAKRLLKFSATLQKLDELPVDAAALTTLHIPAGRVRDANGTIFYGAFDQLIALDKWGDNNGAYRFDMGLKARDVALGMTQYNAAISLSAFLSDYAMTKVIVRNENGKTVYESPAEWKTSGNAQWSWPRLDSENLQVAPGRYALELELRDAYRQKPLRIESRVELPLFYHLSAMDETNRSPLRIVRGERVSKNGIPVIYDEEIIILNLPGVNTTGDYSLLLTAAQSKDLAAEANGVVLQKTAAGFSLPDHLFHEDGLTVRITAGDESVALEEIMFYEQGGGAIGSEPWRVLPQEIKLLANYPNPFNPRTTIPLELPAAGDVEVAVFDRLGRQVATLFNGRMEAGRHYLSFDASHLASGIYFYRLRAGAHIETRKMVVLK